MDIYCYVPEDDEEDRGKVALAYDGGTVDYLTPADARTLARDLLDRADYAESQH